MNLLTIMKMPWPLSSVKRRLAPTPTPGRTLRVVTLPKFSFTTTALIPLLRDIGIEIELWTWDRFLMDTTLPFGAWAITDFDRIHPWMIEVAASRHDALMAAGAPVMNDPRRFLTRAPLIRTLHAMGINRYTCWLPAFAEVPTRFPVFLRTLAAHRGVIGDLLHDPAEAASALTVALTAGHPITDLGFVEYRAKIDPAIGNFQKQAAYRIGNHVVPALTTNDTHWMSKFGINGLAKPETYEAELTAVTDYPHATLIRQVTDLCGARFGRIDFGMVDGLPEIYELNSNPAFFFNSEDHPSPARTETNRRIIAGLQAAFDDIVPKDIARGPVDVSHLTVWLKDKP